MNSDRKAKMEEFFENKKKRRRNRTNFKYGTMSNAFLVKKIWLRLFNLWMIYDLIGQTHWKTITISNWFQNELPNSQTKFEKFQKMVFLPDWKTFFFTFFPHKLYKRQSNDVRCIKYIRRLVQNKKGCWSRVQDQNFHNTYTRVEYEICKRSSIRYRLFLYFFGWWVRSRKIAYDRPLFLKWIEVKFTLSMRPFVDHKFLRLIGAFHFRLELKGFFC